MTITTPSGYEVSIKDFLSFGEKRQLEKLIASRIKIKADSNQKIDMAPVDASINYEMQDMAFGFLVQKIIKGEQEITTNLYDEIMSWPEGDGQAVFNAINEVTAAPLVQAEKKS